MALRQEQVVLIGTAALLGLFLWRGASGDVRDPRARRGGGPQFVDQVAPDPRLALPEPRSTASALDGTLLPRDLFAPPRDTQPLPPLPFANPPLPELTALRPAGSPGLAPRHYGSFLRAPRTVVPVRGLFVAEAEDLEDEALLEQSGGGGVLADLAGLGDADGPAQDLTADERAAQIEGWKKLYDWVRVDAGEPIFGRIANADRYGLAHRPKEALEFTQIDTLTGLERFPGMQPVEYERQRVIEFHFADTASNFIQQERRVFLESMSASRYAAVLAFADRCIELRLKAREALTVAEEMYTLAEAHAQGDPAPALGLARCNEAAFQFEKAYDEYQGLLERFGHRAEVHVGLAELEARFRLFDSAEARLLEAERIERLSWRVQWALGRFLLARGRPDEALAHMQTAFQAEPVDPVAGAVRAGIRADLGRAYLAAGQPAEALAAFERALQSGTPSPAAFAGKLAAARLLPDAEFSMTDARIAATAAGVEQPTFEILLSGGLGALDAGTHELARDLLLQAVESDPLRASQAWGALSWLAETTGYPEEAFRFIEMAVEADPEDAWVLFHNGRVLAARDDVEGAREAFVAALDREIDFTDALIALADLARRADRLGDADLYLERALSIDPARAEIHALRGVGLLQLGDLEPAEHSLRRALEVDPQQPLAHSALAWLVYRRGDSERAVRLFAELDDRRRSLSDEDPYRVFAQAQIERIRDHESKELWTDRFERRELRNGWSTEESAGPQVALLDGVLVLSGDFRQNGSARVFREYAAPDFVAIEVELTVPAENNSRTGLFVAKERRRGAGVTEVQGIVAVARRKDGAVIVRTEDRASADPQWEDVPDFEGGAWWSAEKPVRLRIERSGEGSAAVGRILIDGVPVAEGFSMRQLSSSTNNLRVGIFVEGQTGLPGALNVDDVNVVYRIAQ